MTDTDVIEQMRSKAIRRFNDHPPRCAVCSRTSWQALTVVAGVGLRLRPLPHSLYRRAGPSPIYQTFVCRECDNTIFVYLGEDLLDD